MELVESPHSKDIEAFLLYENIDEKKKAELITKKDSTCDLTSKEESTKLKRKPATMESIIKRYCRSFKSFTEVMLMPVK